MVWIIDEGMNKIEWDIKDSLWQNASENNFLAQIHRFRYYRVNERLRRVEDRSRCKFSAALHGSNSYKSPAVVSTYMTTSHWKKHNFNAFNITFPQHCSDNFHWHTHLRSTPVVNVGRLQHQIAWDRRVIDFRPSKNQFKGSFLHYLCGDPLFLLLNLKVKLIIL